MSLNKIDNKDANASGRDHVFLSLDAPPRGEKPTKKRKRQGCDPAECELLTLVFPRPSVTLSCRLSFCQGERGLPGLPGEPGEKGEAGEGVVGPPVSTWIYRWARLQHLLFRATCNENLGCGSENMVVAVDYELHLWLKTQWEQRGPPATYVLCTAWSARIWLRVSLLSFLK